MQFRWCWREQSSDSLELVRSVGSSLKHPLWLGGDDEKRPSFTKSPLALAPLFSLEAQRAQLSQSLPACFRSLKQQICALCAFAEGIAAAKPSLLLNWPLRCPAAENERDFSDQMFSHVPLQPPSRSTPRLCHESSVRHTAESVHSQRVSRNHTGSSFLCISVNKC